MLFFFPADLEIPAAVDLIQTEIQNHMCPL